MKDFKIAPSVPNLDSNRGGDRKCDGTLHTASHYGSHLHYIVSWHLTGNIYNSCIILKQYNLLDKESYRKEISKSF